MLALAFFQWWYGLGWLRLVRGVGQAIRRVDRAFSVPILLRTLFAPWRRIISRGDNLIESLKAVVDNTVSRLVGSLVRSIVIVAAVILMVGITVGGVLMIVLWPLLPLVAGALLVRGLFPW